ncbi:MAG: ABC transporter ATP-binding protein [Flavobacteriales bacterium]
MDQILLRVNDLMVGFRSERGFQTAVKSVSFELLSGSTLAIVGESGSGKSVSSLSLMALLRKDKAFFEKGRFEFDAEAFRNVFNTYDEKSKSPTFSLKPDDEHLSLLRGKGIAMIFQEPMTSLNPVMTCGLQVSEMIRHHKKVDANEARKRTIALFEEVRLPRATEMFDQYPHQLSGGQRQRVMIAMAISCEPRILIADEPTTALDVTVQKGILELLKSLQTRYNMAMIFITHDLGVVAEIADNIVVMRKGEVVEKGSAKDILTNPKEPYTRGLMACRPDPEKKSVRLKTVDDFLKTDDPESILRNDIRIPSELESMQNALLEVRHLSKIYEGKKSLFRKNGQEVRAVNDVNFNIGLGETLGLVGESGCGKTTLSRMLLGLIPASEGQILFKGKDITQLSSGEMRSLRKDMQIIFQDPYSALNPQHTIREAITEPMQVFGLHESAKGRLQRAKELMIQVGLSEDFLDRYPHEFSGGQRQRIVIARALAVQPSFLICDESVSALDVSVQAQVLNLLNDLKHQFNLTFLFISHDLNVVYYMSDRIMVMNKGKIEEMGPASDVFYRPQKEYTQLLLDSIPGRKSLSN